MSHPVDKFVGQKLRMRRKLLDLTQQSVAEAVGVTFQQVQKYERGVNRISASKLMEFADALKVPVTYFFEGLNQDQEYSPKATTATVLADVAGHYQADVFSNPETIELLRYFYRCSPTIRKQFTEMLKAMANNKATVD